MDQDNSVPPNLPPAKKANPKARLTIKVSRKMSHGAKSLKSPITSKVSHYSKMPRTPKRKTQVSTLKRSLSYDTLPKMKNKMFICQPITMQRRLALPAHKVYFTYKNQHLTLVCLTLISFTSMLALAIIAPFFPTESSKKGMRESVNGLIFSAYALVYMVFSPVISLIIPYMGTKLTLILGVFVAGVSNILFGLLDKIDDLNTFTAFCFLVRVFEAVGGSAFSTATYTILMDEFSDNIGSAFGIVETSVGLGLSLGPAIGGFLYSIGGYGLPFFVLGGVMLLNIPICMILISDSKACKIIKSPMKAYVKLISNPKTLINALAIVMVAQLVSYLDPTLEPHLREIGLQPHYVSLVFLIMSATYTLTAPFMGWISNLFSNKFQLISIGLFLLAIEFFFLGPSEWIEMETSFTQIAVTMAFIGVSYSIAFIPTFETMLGLSMKDGFPDDLTTYSLVSGLWSSFLSLGEILGPIFGGILTENLGFKQSSTIMAACALGMAIVCSITCIYFHEFKPYRRKSINKKKPTKSGMKNGKSGLSEKTPLLA